MVELRTSEWRRAHDFREEFVATAEKIGQQLQVKLAKIVAEPLPAEIHDLLREIDITLS
ncbi:hypothetical protein IYW40_02950 [Methylocystis sp. H4A]|uniref:hypothetical protein n=1 Tax=Methylocystis sp. H4A TaxID=2785788 RepID=UPI0018C323EE|nr:hypothetical protein [Methylocystis sp. H4A]MBG0800458.1 hypothetical protein [Methylocystis sp. H4A]